MKCWLYRILFKIANELILNNGMKKLKEEFRNKICIGEKIKRERDYYERELLDREHLLQFYYSINSRLVSRVELMNKDHKDYIGYKRIEEENNLLKVQLKDVEQFIDFLEMQIVDVRPFREEIKVLQNRINLLGAEMELDRHKDDFRGSKYLDNMTDEEATQDLKLSKFNIDTNMSSQELDLITSLPSNVEIDFILRLISFVQRLKNLDNKIRLPLKDIFSEEEISTMRGVATQERINKFQEKEKGHLKEFTIEETIEIYLEYIAEVDLSSFTKERQKKDGAVYTPQEIITWIHDKLKASINLNKTYFEPACGSGRFLFDWYKLLYKHWQDSRNAYPEISTPNAFHKHVCENCLFFSELHKPSIQVAMIGLMCCGISIGATDLKVSYNSYCGDTLLDDPFNLKEEDERRKSKDKLGRSREHEKRVEKFDYCAGNPPYIGFNNGKSAAGRSKGLNKDIKAKYKEIFNSYDRYGDIYDLFIENGLKRGSLVGFVVRGDVLDLDTKGHDKLRRCIYNHNSLLDFRTELFEQINLRGMSIIISSSKVTPNKNSILLFQKNKSQIASHIKGRLSDFIQRIGGFNTINGESVSEKRRPILEKRSGDKGYITSATQFNKYSTINYEFCLNQDEVKALEKQVSTWNRKGILVKYTLDISKSNQGFTVGDENCWGQINCATKLVPKNPKHLLPLLGILNSNLILFLIKDRADKRAGNEAWLKISTEIYDSLPIIELSESIVEKLIPLVDKMLVNPNDTATEQDINIIVYNLYNLTKEEIKEIEEDLK